MSDTITADNRIYRTKQDHEEIQALQEQRQEMTFIDVIAAAARDPTVDVGKMQALLNMKMQIEARDAETAYNVAMRATQQQIGPVVRRSKNDHTKSRYAKLEDIDADIRPVYTDNGFSLSFDSPDTPGDIVTVSCTVSHIGGHSEKRTLSGALDGAGAKGVSNKTGIQSLGSTVTYLRRYLTCMIFNVVLTDEDNDGNKHNAEVNLSQQEADDIQSLIAEIGMDEAAVATFLRIVEAKSISDIKRGVQHRIAMNHLAARRRVNR